MLIGLALALSLAGCGNVAEPVAPRTKPSDLIPDAEFTQLLLEMHLIEGARGGEGERCRFAETARGAENEGEAVEGTLRGGGRGHRARE